jgi:phage gp46-like protein
MRLRAQSLFLYGLFASCLVLGTSSVVTGADSKLIRFQIKDQFDRVHSEEALKSRVVLVLCGDREGSRYQGLWGDRIRDSLRVRDRLSSVLLLDVADLRGVQRKFRRETPAWVLLDGKGRVVQACSVQADSLNLALFEQTGTLVYQVGVQEPDPVELEVLMSRIAQLPRD